jgi:hypothetical protein
MVPFPNEHDADASGVGKRPAFVLAGAHSLVGSDKGRFSARHISNSLYQKNVRCSARYQIERVKNLKLLGGADSVSLRQYLDGAGDGWGHILIERHPHEARRPPKPTPMQ